MSNLCYVEGNPNNALAGQGLENLAASNVTVPWLRLLQEGPVTSKYLALGNPGRGKRMFLIG